jgi:hypothetical protein
MFLPILSEAAFTRTPAIPASFGAVPIPSQFFARYRRKRL